MLAPTQLQHGCKPADSQSAGQPASQSLQQQQSNSVQVGRAGANSLFRFFCRFAGLSAVACLRCTLKIALGGHCSIGMHPVPFKMHAIHSPLDDDPHDRLYAFLPSNIDALKSIQRICNTHYSNGWFLDAI
ncbi:unnamed protein product [Ceratitis capitata]|uniref:(Mediterranean fruit fly) hypothetical protein n=1 Tax=Ceratitis capitata TaxID=7213 RepID=A0A811V874_CERCA|nr:unnamed protein product [Ceratitis capitata]